MSGLKSKCAWNIISNDYVIEYRIRAAALTQTSYFRRPRWLSHDSSRFRDERHRASQFGPTRSSKLPEETCAYTPTTGTLAGWLAGCEAYESVQIGPNDAAGRVKAKVRRDQFAGERETENERANEREAVRKPLDTQWNRFRARDVKSESLRARSEIKAHLVSFLPLDSNC